MQNVAAYLYRAKQKSGKPHLYVHFEAKSDDHAETKRDYLFMEAGYSKADYFTPLRINFPVVDGLPVDGAFSESFWLSWALEGDSGRTCFPRDKVDPSVAIPKLYPYMLKADTDTPAKTPEPPAKEETTFSAIDLDKHTVIAAAWLFGRDCMKMTGEQLKAATRLMMDDSQRYPQNVIMALSNLKGFDYVYPDMPIVAIAAIKTIWPPFDKAPELGKLSQFATEYLNAKVDDRQSVISKWQTSPSAANNSQVELPRTSSGALAGTGKNPVYGTPIASFSELETVTYLAHYPSDFDISRPPIGIVNAVKEMKTRKEKSPLAWYGQLSETPGILDFSREAVGTLIRNAPETLHLTPGPLRDYINANLIEIDAKTAKVKNHAQTQSLPQGEADSLVDEQLANETLAGAATSAGSASLAGELTASNASNDGEKEEVDAAKDLDPTTRSAWLRREIMTALDGKTSVMSVDDVKELMVNVGDLNHVYLARLLTKEIEPCDPFKQLAKDDIYHLTCDVLEGWADDKEERCQLIDERVEFCLKEARQTLEQADVAGQHKNAELARHDASNGGEKTEVAQQQPAGELHAMGSGKFDVSELFATSPLANVDNAASTDLRENEDLTTKDVREFLDSSTKPADLSGECAPAAQEVPVATAPAYFEPGRYHDIPNDVYHAANGISSTMLKDARVSLMYFNARHVAKTIKKVHSKVLDLGNLVHTMALEPEKLEQEFSIEPIIPKGAFTTTASMREFIDKHNASLPKMTDSDTLRSIIDAHNATLQTPYALGGNADEIGQFYTLLPAEFQRIGEDQKPTATAMKACIKEYNATLRTPLKTSGGREALLEQLAIIDPEFVKLELAIPSPLAVSGSKEDMAARIKTILPNAVFADELIEQWRNTDDDRVLVTQQQMQEAKAIQHALFNHPSSGPMLQHSQRTVEASYFGYDEDTGMEIRVRPDLEIDLDGVRIGFDLKTISMWSVKQGAVRARLHREIIERDYHLSAAMYSDVAAFDQFFWIFVNKDEGYNWVAIVEASPDLLELGRLEYKEVLRDIKQAYDTNIWPAPITEEIVDDLNDFDRRRLEALRVA
ncbi:PD-(D/E)XK nuclease-like domain-containing protein [Serratia sp. JSRIV001]|uniref:PD-(D/E)XK nuclease-like domain-containing protein n=1 Tax=unclassified Serratia (in: enterobacteria) TaxID=2647522 RepID=UPI001CBB33CE|nr:MULTISPECIES: PD-(D/E)XK nuclease-like domain-containing protein [unclassified Serratia (in: enterobacteria)]UAN48015.1 PD-(D/E)XK nuclease-like domain-containing protein [Serratia sp. JSRIV001]UAN53796.1 PD-(D/E)XK nuclease-like domain-containing protein [Serratia sp. JSRIV002]UAN65121.1 PD-(D/E)XK nuclease-like domain-containing protein [Serratia sp. JSRIV006]